MSRVKAIVNESSMFSIATPSVVQLTEALKSAQNWTAKVESMLVGFDAVYVAYSSLLFTCVVCYRLLYTVAV